MPDLILCVLAGLAAALFAVLVDRRARRSRRVRRCSSQDGRGVERAFVEQFVTEDPVERVTRQRDEYFVIIERIEQERNQWVEMWRAQAAEHQTAQALLGQQLAQTRQVAARAIHMLNALRKQHGLEAIKGPAHLLPYDGEPVFEPEKYAFRMLALRERLGPPTDAVAARDALDVEFRDQDENP